MDNNSSSFRIRLTHTAPDNKEIVEYIMEDVEGSPGAQRVVGKRPAPHAWQVACASHTRFERSLEGRRDIETLDGDWACQECSKFDWKAENRLREALRDPKFSHATRRGHYGQNGIVYHNDPESPTGVFASGVSFDPFNPRCEEVIREETDRSSSRGPQRGNFAGSRS